MTQAKRLARRAPQKKKKAVRTPGKQKPGQQKKFTKPTSPAKPKIATFKAPEKQDLLTYLVKPLTADQEKKHSRTMGLFRNGPMVDREYAQVPPNQFLREAVQNAIEAGADEIRISPAYHLDANSDKPTWKICISDNGCGMSEMEMVQYINNLSASGKRLGRNNNFGVGLKTSMLPRHPVGLHVISFQKGKGNMLRMGKLRSNEYGLIGFPTEKGFEETMPISDKILSYYSHIKDHGTLVIGMGQTANEPTFMTSDKRDPSLAHKDYRDLREHIKYLNNRYFTIPDGVTVKVTEFQNSSPKLWPTSQKASRNLVMNRDVYGQKYYLDRTALSKGQFEVEGIKYHWYLMEPSGNVRREVYHAYWNPESFVGLLYGNEVYDQQTSSENHRMYYKFGITPNSVMKNLVILVEPPHSSVSKFGVESNSSRSGLQLRDNNTPLIWHIWGDKFKKHMPKAVRKAIEQAVPEETNTVDAVEHRLKPFLQMMKAPTGLFKRSDEGNFIFAIPREHVIGSDPTKRSTSKGETQKSTGGGTGSMALVRSLLKTSDTIRVRAVPLVRMPIIPKIEWVSIKRGSREFGDRLENKFGEYIKEADLLRLNEDFFELKNRANDLLEKYGKGTPRAQDIIWDSVKREFATEVSSRVTHCKELRHVWGEAAFDNTTSIDSLTTSVMGVAWANRLGRIVANRVGKSATEAVSDV